VRCDSRKGPAIKSESGHTRASVLATRAASVFKWEKLTREWSNYCQLISKQRGKPEAVGETGAEIGLPNSLIRVRTKALFANSAIGQ
jgi:hypothetical protein